MMTLIIYQSIHDVLCHQTWALCAHDYWCNAFRLKGELGRGRKKGDKRMEDMLSISVILTGWADYHFEMNLIFF